MPASMKNELTYFLISISETIMPILMTLFNTCRKWFYICSAAAWVPLGLRGMENWEKYRDRCTLRGTGSRSPATCSREPHCNKHLCCNKHRRRHASSAGFCSAYSIYAGEFVRRMHVEWTRSRTYSMRSPRCMPKLLLATSPVSDLPFSDSRGD